MHNLPPGPGWNRVKRSIKTWGSMAPQAPAVPTVLYRGAVKLVFVFENSCETIHFTTVANDL